VSTRREFITLLGGYRKAAYHTTNQLILSESQNSYGRPHKNKRSYVHAQASW
jgi:hypothetical protein